VVHRREERARVAAADPDPDRERRRCLQQPGPDQAAGREPTVSTAAAAGTASRATSPKAVASRNEP
jgi:hypothetical protein